MKTLSVETDLFSQKKSIFNEKKVHNKMISVVRLNAFWT